MIWLVLLMFRLVNRDHHLHRKKSLKCTVLTPFMYLTYTVHAPHMCCTKLLINKFMKEHLTGQNIFTYSCTSLYSACMVNVWCFVGCMYVACTGKKRALCGATLVHVWCMYSVFMTKIILEKNNKPVHEAKLKRLWSRPIGKQHW